MSELSSVPVILLAFANDRRDEKRYLRNLPDELRKLRTALRPAVDSGLCEVVELANATAEDIFAVFQSREYRGRIAVFHFGGHAGSYELLLESQQGAAAVANASGLARFLGQQNSLQLVFLNGCSTQQQTEGLLNEGVDAVVTTATAINDEVATQLSARFYRGLASGVGLDAAFNESVAAAVTEAGGNTRALYAETEAAGSAISERCPWDLYFRDGAEAAAEWNLPDTANNPLFGLPPLPETDLPQTPYRHLQWFTREHAPVFFGRGNEIRDLYRKVTNPVTAPIILFYGQSGVGKSSLLDAGLIPRLESSHHVLYLRRDAQQGLSGTLDLAFLPDGVGLSARDGWKTREKNLGCPMTVILDQVEEIFTRPCGAVSRELELFLDYATDIFLDRQQRPEGRLILGFRKEWLAEIKRQLSEFRLPYTEVFLQNLDRRGVMEVVNGPTSSEPLREQYNLTVQPGLAQQIADDLLEDAAGAVAPTMQILLSRMWEAATANAASDPKFTRDVYTSMRRQGLLLRHFLNRQLSFIEKQWPDVVSPDLLLDLLSLHTTPLGTAEERDLTELQQLYAHHSDELPRILEGCKDAYLLTLPTLAQDANAATRLAHDTLAPLVRERYEKSDHPGQRARRILENRVFEWHDGATGTALDEQDLSIVEAGRTGMRSWSADEQRLVEASVNERKKRQRSAKIRRMLGLSAVAAIMVCAGVAVLYAARADQERENAQRQTEAAERATARSLVLPLREFEEVYVAQRNQPAALTNPELDSLWSLTASEDEQVHRHVFEAVFREPRIAERVTNRSAALVRAAVGLDADRREAVLAIVEQVLSGGIVRTEQPQERSLNVLPLPLRQGPPLGFPEPDWRVITACATVANELKPLDDELTGLIVLRLIDEIENTTDPRLLTELATALATYRPHLSPDQMTAAYNGLFAIDLTRTSGNFPDRLAPALHSLAEATVPDSALGFLKTALDCWTTAQHNQAMAMEETVLTLAWRVPNADAVSAWEYLWDRCRSFPSYRQPRKLFEALGVLADKSPEAAAKVAAVLIPHLQQSAERYGYFAGFGSLLKAIRQQVSAEDLNLLISSDDQWTSVEVRDWVKVALVTNQAAVDHTSDKIGEIVDGLLDSWVRIGTDMNLNFWGVTDDNRHAIVSELTRRCCDAGTDQNRISHMIAFLAHISPDGSLIDRHGIQRSLLSCLSAAATPETIFNDGGIIKNLAALNLPLPKADLQRIQTLIAAGINTAPAIGASFMAEAAVALSPLCTNDILTSLVPAALHGLTHGKFVNDRQNFAQLLMVPGVKLTASQTEAAATLVHQLFMDVLNPQQGRRNGYDIKRLPMPAKFLTEAQQAEIAAELEDLFLGETQHQTLGSLGEVRGNFCKPVETQRLNMMLTKLSLWLYRLPPAMINTSPPTINSNAPAALCEAILALEPSAADRERLVLAHAVMHAMLQQDFEEYSGRALRHTLQVLSTNLEPTSLLSAAKAPWCVDDAQQIILSALEQRGNVDLDGRIWNLSGAAAALKITPEELAARELFPPELRYDADSPTYAPAKKPSDRDDQLANAVPRNLAAALGATPSLEAPQSVDEAIDYPAPLNPPPPPEPEDANPQKMNPPDA